MRTVPLYTHTPLVCVLLLMPFIAAAQPPIYKLIYSAPDPAACCWRRR